jgi:hypothetical protein
LVPGVLTRQQIAPEFDRGLGFLDIFEKCAFAVKAPPAAGLEQFGEVFQPLLRKTAPAGNNIAATRQVHVGVYVMCHKPARKEENGRRRNRDESTGDDRDILWKTSSLSSAGHYRTSRRERNPHIYGVFHPIHSQAAQQHGRVACAMP